VKDGEYVNFEILKRLAAYLKEQNPGYIFETILPEAIPRGTLFSSYDVADFLNRTMVLMDKCNKFFILDNDYYNSAGYFSSIWTEAEAFIWSRYDRDMFLSTHRNKEKFFNIMHYENGEFSASRKELLKLASYQNRLLQIASLDFDKTPRPGMPNYSMPYLKNARIYFIVCDNCKSVFVTEKIKNNKHEDFQKVFSCSDCENKLALEFKDGYLVCNQEKHSAAMNRMSIFDTLELLFGNENKYPVIKF
jgi:hypothetical protein